MMFTACLFLLFLTVVDGESYEHECTYVAVLKHLNVTKNKEMFTMTRPVKNYTKPTVVTLDVLLYGILDVREKDQQLVPFVWIDVWWQNDYISWNPEDFCGIENTSLPIDILWQPDLTIEEMTDKDKAQPNPFLVVHYDGETEVTNDQVLVSACRMHVYKFPFDIQNCNLSFKSVVHSDREIQLVPYLNSSEILKRTLMLMQTQYEWLFVNMTVHSKTVNVFDFSQSVVVYTISIKRRSALYIVNFMLPILFFLCLDLASFMISDSGGEKLSFKVTVLLAVTVMQLLLNEILPLSSNRIPLIAVYCVGIFGLMMLSLLETVLVMYLLRKDSKENEAAKNQSPSGDCEDIEGKIIINNSFRGETPSDLSLVAKEGNSRQLTEESRDFEKLLIELNEVVKTLSVLLHSNDGNEEVKRGHWKRMTKTINRAFIVFYVVSVTLFLVYMSFRWNSP